MIERATARAKFTYATALVFMVPIGILSAAAILVRLPLYCLVSFLDGIIKTSLGLLRSWARPS